MVHKSFCKLDFIVTAISLIMHLSSTDTCLNYANELRMKELSPEVKNLHLCTLS